MKRRVLSMFLATAMVLSAVDITVFAYEKGNEYAVAFEAGMEVTANPAEEITIDSNEELIVTPTTEEDSEEKSQEPASESPEESKKEESIEEPEEVTEELTEEPEDELIEDEQDTVIPEEEEENTETTTLPEKAEVDTTEMIEIESNAESKEVVAATVTASGECGDNLTWVLDSNGVLTISGTGDMWDHFNTSDVYSAWKPYISDIVTLNLENGITHIGKYAFNECSGLTGNLVIPESVTSIGEYAFNECSGFTGELIIPQSVSYIGAAAFGECSGFTGNLIIPEGVTSIEKYAFYGCSGFTGNLKIPDGVTSIKWGAFTGCNFSGGLSIPESVTIIGEFAFSDCNGFTGELIIPESVTSIGGGAFYGCSGFTGELIIPESVTSIGEGASGAFYGCSGFTGDLIIPKSVTSIGSEAFSMCSGFTGNLKIPESVTSIGRGAFSGCSGFTGDLIIPKSVESIGRNAFVACYNLSGIAYIPRSVTSIGTDALGPIHTIYGVIGSYAETYARENDIAFIEYDFGTPDNEMKTWSLLENEAGIVVYDAESKEYLEDVVVEVGENIYTTDSEGFITFQATDEKIKIDVTAQKENYVSVETVREIKNGTIAYIQMLPFSDDIMITAVNAELLNEKYDLLSDKLVLGYVSDLSEITHTTDQNLFITVKTNDVAVKYEIVSRNSENDDVQETVVISSDNGKFTIPVSTGGTTVDNDTISASMPVLSRFEPGVQYFVKVTNSNGDSTSKPIGISTTTNYLTAERRYQSGSMKLGEKLEIQISDDIPLIGGGKLNFGFKNAFPVEV